MSKYIYKRREDDVYIINPVKIYEKIQVAARMIAAIPEPETVICVSRRETGQRAVYKFGHYTQGTSIAGRWTPGMLTNQITKKFVEPRLLIVNDPRLDYKALVEGSYVNIPVIAICGTDNNLTYVDCAIPCNNRSKQAIAMVYYLLTKAVMELKGKSKDFEQAVPGEFMFRDDKEEKKNEEEYVEEGAEEGAEEGQGEAAGDDESEGDENFV